jgi:hypothetical protein
MFIAQCFTPSSFPVIRQPRCRSDRFTVRFLIQSGDLGNGHDDQRSGRSQALTRG